MKKNSNYPGVYLQFTRPNKFGRGFLSGVLLINETDAEHEMLERELCRLMNPGCFSWIRRLFRK